MPTRRTPGARSKPSRSPATPRSRRPGRGLATDLVGRLLEVGSLGQLVSEISDAARALTRAVSCEVLLGSAPGGAPGGRRLGTRPQGRGARHPRGDSSWGSALEGGRVVARSPGGVVMRVPVRHAGRNLGCLRLEWRERPSLERLDHLRRYLAHAGAALARILAEDKLSRQHRRYEALLDSLPDACLLVLAPDCTVIGVRGRLQATAGLDTSQILGSPLVGDRRGLLRLPRARLRQLVAEARRHRKTETETWLRGAEGEIQVLLTLVDLGQRGEMVCVLRDLTQWKSMEIALLKHVDELSRAAERLREVDLLKNEFMSNVSHELRTPLTAIIAYSEALLLAPPDAETEKAFLRVIAEQGHKLQRLIGGLLDIAKIESLATELKLQPGSMNDVVRSAVVTVQPLADKGRVSIVTTLDPGISEIWLDELRAQQIVWNLLTNAIKYSPPGSTVRVRTWETAGRVWTAVEDEGPGIAPEHLELIFEKFVQIDGSTTRHHGGVGLGLGLVKDLVDLHGGEVHVDSTPGQGATFVFSMPVEKRRRPRLARPRSRAVASRSAS